MNQIITLTISHAKPSHAMAIAAFFIHFLPLSALLLSDQDDKTRNPQYNKYIKATKANIQSIRFMTIFIKANTYHNSVS
jgi:hypothetical protein